MSENFRHKHSSIQSLISQILIEIKLNNSWVKGNGTSFMMDFYVTRFLGVPYKPIRWSEKIEVRWIPHASGWIKANIDGLTSCNPSSVSFEVIFGDGYASFKGGFVQASQLHLPKSSVLWCLLLKKQRSWTGVIFRLKQSLKRWSTYLNKLLRFLRGLSNRWNNCLKKVKDINCCCSHVLRKGNALAYSLAKNGHGQPQFYFQWQE